MLRQIPRSMMSVFSVLSLLPCLSLLSGCSFSGVPGTSSGAGVSIQGRVQGGQQAVVGAHVYLFAANTTGYGQPSVPLLNPALTAHSDSIGAYVLTAADGSFSITPDYTCTPNSQVYLYVLGGNAGAGTNPAAGMLAILGNCPAAKNFFPVTPFVWVNEVSTVAAAFAMSGFATDATHVSSSGTPLALTGIANAFANASNLANLAAGVALATTPAGNGTPLQTNTNTVANILASCVNSTGAVSGPTSPTTCYTLFNNATSDGTPTGTLPTDTATAAINIAHNPTANIAALYALQSSSAPFQPQVVGVPRDFYESILFPDNRNGLNGEKQCAIDASGNVWIADYGNSNIVELSPLGVQLSPAGGFTGGGIFRPIGIAIDPNGNVWTSNANATTGAVSKFSSSGTALSPSSGYTGGGLIGQGLALAIDGTGNVWVANGGTTARISEISNAGVPVSTSTGFSGGGISHPQALAIDSSNNVWIGNSNASISELSSLGVPLSPSTGFTGGGLNGSYSIAVDGSDNIWVGDAFNNSVAEFSNAGSAISPSTGYTGGALGQVSATGPFGVAIDGSGSAFVAIATSTTAAAGLTKFSSTGTPLTPANDTIYGGANVVTDGSGNIWLNAGSQVLIGAATPVVTPISAAVATHTLGTRP